MKSIDELFEEEDSRLASFAVKNRDTVDRVVPEENHPYRLPLNRDRDRICHSRSFKRLEYKTQVFINSEGDHFRTRLTHTLEVAGVSRTISTALGLNSHLSEVIALAHDLGHTPFGHAGQDILSELMKDYGGFEHNKQSLRIVQKLENKNPEFVGLNLSRMSLIGLMKHGASYESSDLAILRTEKGPSLEAIVTDLADEIAYSHHDIDDGIEMKYLDSEDLDEVELWRKHFQETKEKFPGIGKELIARRTIRSMMNEMITDLIQNTSSNIQKYNIRTREDFASFWKQRIEIVGYSKEISLQLRALKSFLMERLYKNPSVVSKSNMGQKIIEFLFHYLEKNREKIPRSYRERMEDEDFFRVLSDYISGMTDRYAESKALEFGFKG